MRFRFGLISLMGLVLFGGGRGLAAEPEWGEAWQGVLAGWMKGLEPGDVSVGDKAFDWSKLAPEEMRRNSHLATGYAPPVSLANAALRLPADSFLWASIWRPDLPVKQEALKPYPLSSGEIWTPTHPSVACLLGWLYGWERPWNPYYHDKAVARRAAIISMISLIMIRDDIRYWTSGGEGCRQPPFSSPHTGIQGFSLTFNAFTYLQVADALPPEVRKAWGEGLRWFAELLAKSPPRGPENMRLSVPVGVYYTGLALEDEGLRRLADQCMNGLLASEYSMAGYIRDAGVPDGSYNGISLHRLAEYHAISGSAFILDILRQSYRLKEYMVLPEPGGGTLSPSHFNARCQDGFDNDQYKGREIMLLPDVPEAAWFARKFWPENLTQETVAEQTAANAERFSNRVPQATAWGVAGGSTENKPHGWGRVMDLPYVMYHGKDEAKMDQLIRAADKPVALWKDRYTEDFGGEFYVVRRPAYAAIFYAGPAVESDDGATNSRGVVQNQGGYFMGFGGGGLSAFWTPEAGSLLLGRMTAKEGYERKTVRVGSNAFQVGGWRDWMTNHVVGETPEGKILSSSRIAHPRSRLVNDGARLEMKGTFPKSLKRQGPIIDAELSYFRSYDFTDRGVDCCLEIRTDRPLKMKSLYEVLPLVMSVGKDAEGPMEFRFLNAENQMIEEKAGRVEGVSTLEMRRHDGVARVEFPRPINFAMASEEGVSRQNSVVRGRAFLIELPVELEPDKPLRFEYRLIVPSAAAGEVAKS